MRVTEKWRKITQDRQYNDKSSTEVRSRNHCCCHGIAKSITYSECMFVDPVIQHAKRMRIVIVASVVYPAVPHFPTLSTKRHDFQKIVLENKIYVLSFPSTFVSHISCFKKKSAGYHNFPRYVTQSAVMLFHGTSHKVPL
jgi:hypothetical protein